MQNLTQRIPNSQTIALNEELQILADISKRIGSIEIDNNLYKGLFREDLLRALLIKLLKQDIVSDSNVEVASGYILHEDRISNQIDVIIYKSGNDKIIFESPSYVITGPENVYATIELKSTLNIQAFREALSNQHSVYKASRDVNDKILKFIVGISSDYNISLIKKWLVSFYQGELSDVNEIYRAKANQIFALDNKQVIHFGEVLFPRRCPAFFVGEATEEISGFQIFYANILRSLVEQGISIPNADAYLNFLPGEQYRADNFLNIDWENPYLIEVEKP